MATKQTQLTQEQLELHKAAVEKHIISTYKADKSKLGTVVLVPAFEWNDTTNSWEPVANLIREAKGDNNFIHLGSIVLGAGLKPTPRYTNSFQADSKLNTLLEMWDLIDDTMKGKLIVQESTEPFSSTNPARDIKWANRDLEIPCMADGQVIYRRTIHTQDMSATDTLVAHTNIAEIRESFQQATKPQSAGILNAGNKKAQRVK